MKKDPLNTELVRAFVGAAHADLDKVKQMLIDEPDLLHATMNWGGGDWETALGAAAHVGRRDIAQWLIAKGARFDLFASAMLGDLDLVKATLEQYPELIDATGPHGISLIQHAYAGGQEAQEVASYIKQLRDIKEGNSVNETIVVENKIEVRASFGDGIAERFRTAKSVHTFPGFIRMDVWRSTNEAGNEEIRVCTMWESEAQFNAWANSDSFRHAHAKRQESAQKKEESQPSNPIVGNKVTIHRVEVTHFPAVKSVDEEALV